MLRQSAIRSRHRNSPRPAWRVAEAFQQWVRGRPCYLADKGGCGVHGGRKPVEFAHVDCAGGKGMGVKVADQFGIPLCPRHHDEQHGKIGEFRNRGGWPTFQIKYGFNAVKVAGEYWRAWPGRLEWERQQEESRGA